MPARGSQISSMTGRMKARDSGRIALGVRSHSGWAAYVLLGGRASLPTLLARGRMELCDPSISGAKQPFHTAEPMAFPDGERFIGECARATAAFAERALMGFVRQHGAISACCVLTASGRPLPDLKSILASHALIHAAEGEFYRDAIVHAAEKSGISVERLRERDMVAASERLPGTETERKVRLEEFGRQVGPPWRQDEKLSALAGWMALAARPAPPGTRKSRVLA
jgi:hypothetical protein